MPSRATLPIPTAFKVESMSLTASATGYVLFAVGSGTTIFAEVTPPIGADPLTNRLIALTGVIGALGGLWQIIKNSRVESKKLSEVLKQNADQSAKLAEVLASNESQARKLNALHRDMEAATAERDLARSDRETAVRRADELARKVDELKHGQTVLGSKVDATRRILIVEDDAETCRQLTRFLTIKGFDVVCAATIAEARRAFTGRCAWIFVHRAVAGEDGLAYIREIKAKGLNIKLAMVTGHPGEDVLEQADRAFVDLICHKPINLDRMFSDMLSLEEKAPRPNADDVEIVKSGSKVDFPAVKGA